MLNTKDNKRRIEIGTSQDRNTHIAIRYTQY